MEVFTIQDIILIFVHCSPDRQLGIVKTSSPELHTRLARHIHADFLRLAQALAERRLDGVTARDSVFAELSDATLSTDDCANLLSR
jgi:hypothetical protein